MGYRSPVRIGNVSRAEISLSSDPHIEPMIPLGEWGQHDAIHEFAGTRRHFRVAACCVALGTPGRLFSFLISRGVPHEC